MISDKDCDKINGQDFSIQISKNCVAGLRITFEDEFRWYLDGNLPVFVYLPS